MRIIHSRFFRNSIAVFLFIFLPAVSFAQNKIQHVEFSATPVDVLNPDGEQNLSCKIYLTDSLSITSVQIKVGVQLHNSEVMLSDVNFAVPVPPVGQLFTRNNLVIDWLLGNINITQPYYYEITLFDFQNSSIGSFIIQM